MIVWHGRVEMGRAIVSPVVQEQNAASRTRAEIQLREIHALCQASQPLNAQMADA